MTEEVKPDGEDCARLTRDDRPYQFGQRYLTNEDEVWNHNAWDHVEWGDKEKHDALEKLEEQKNFPVPEFEKEQYMANPGRFWDLFYRNNKDNFFKDRGWLRIEFPVLYEAIAADAGSKTILEVGCGAGNTMFPLLESNTNPALRIIGVDFSPRAVELVRTNKKFDEKFAHATIWDLANSEGILPQGVEEHSVDIIVMIFVFSALAPSQWKTAVANLRRLMHPGSIILFRDYGRYDLTQVRFKKYRLLQDNFYIRGDGTRVYYFTEEELEEIFSDFEYKKIAADRRLIVNRKRRIKMHRIWLQAEFRL